LGKILEDLQAIPEFRSVRWIVDVDPNWVEFFLINCSGSCTDLVLHKLPRTEF
jgi:hypothetical protein